MTKISSEYSLKAIRNRSFPDSILITIQAKVGRKPDFRTLNFNNDEPKIGRFKLVDQDFDKFNVNEAKRCYLDPTNPKKGYVIRFDNYDIVTVRLSLNGQEIFKEIAIKILKLKRCPNTIFSHGKNFLPAKLYSKLDNSDIKYLDLKNSVNSQIIIAIRDSINELKSNYLNLFGVKIPDEKILLFLKKCEICTDFVVPQNYKLANDSYFHQQFDNVIHNHTITEYKDNKKHIPINLGVEKTCSFDDVTQITGYHDKSLIVKAYDKSLDGVGATIRLETKAEKDALDKVLYWGRWLPHDGEMPLFGIRARLNKLTRVHAKTVHEILKNKPLSKNKKFSNRLRKATKINCGMHGAEIARAYLKWGVLSTAQKSKLSNAAKRVVRKNSGTGELFYKVTNRVASYKVSKKYLTSYFGQF